MQDAIRILVYPVSLNLRAFLVGGPVSPMSPLSIDTVEFALQNTLQGHTKPVNSLCVSPDKTRLISVSAFSHFLNQLPFTEGLLGDDSKVIVWSVLSGEKLFMAQRPFNGPATAASWVSRDSSRFVVGFASGDLHLFSSENGKVIVNHRRLT